MSLSASQHEYFYSRITRVQLEMNEAFQAMRKSRKVFEHVQRYIFLAVELEILQGIYLEMQSLR